MISPDPVPPPLGPLAAIVTTEGTTLLATGVTEQAASEAPEEEAPELALAPDEGVLLVVQPATTPPMSSTDMGTRRGSQREVPSFRTVDGTMTSPGCVVVPVSRTDTASARRAPPASPSTDEPAGGRAWRGHLARLVRAGWDQISQTAGVKSGTLGKDAAPGGDRK